MDGRKEFEEMYRRYYASVYKYIYEKVSHRQEAEDLTNEVFLSCLKHFKRFDSSRASAATWLFAITRNRLKNYYRDKKSMVSVDDEMFMVELADESCVDEAALLAQLRAVLARALDSLSEREKKIIILKFFYHKDSAQIGEALGLTPVNVRVIMSRALSKMKVYIEKNKEWE